MQHDTLQRKGQGHPGLNSGLLRPFQIEWEPLFHDLELWCLIGHRMDECRKNALLLQQSILRRDDIYM